MFVVRINGVVVLMGGRINAGDGGGGDRRVGFQCVVRREFLYLKPPGDQ